ncbi:MAG: tRNA (guanosine(46)-N7)-methyltransferase TrmB [Pseudomonadota bacterium]|nr:tRNA (guanosine(46)-N7)-methyltransferase TrmB [Pseudomonadota bacterium]
MQHKKQRPIRSYVRREGRITSAQQRALDELGSVYGVPDSPKVLNLASIFPHAHNITLEIGFGDGRYLQQLAATCPNEGFIGIETYRPGIGRLLRGIAEEKLSNLRVLIGDAQELVPTRFPTDRLSNILILFPDPWPKKRHHKRRLITEQFLTHLAKCLSVGGHLLMATDCEDYAVHVKGCITRSKNLSLLETADSNTSRTRSMLTKYACRATTLGQPIREIRAVRC